MTPIEVAAAGAAISVTLNIVATKLVPLVIKWYSSVVGVEKHIEELLVLVKQINKWLQGTGYEAMVNDDPLFDCLTVLKEVVSDVDDVVDEFHLKAQKHAAAGGVGIISENIPKPKSFRFRWNAASKIKKIKRRLAAVVKDRIDYTALTNSISVDASARHTNMRPQEMPSLTYVDVASIVGRDEQKEHIISKLVESNDQQKIKIISVIGLGGSGKTALAKLVFNDGNINKHFEARHWVHVSKQVDVQKLVKKLFESITGENSETYPLQQLSNKILENLSAKRYMLVLDDVWIDDQFDWDNFMEYLNIGAHGSSILLTTRSKRVAEVVRSTVLFDLPFLSESDSWQVFVQSFRMPPKGLDSEFVEVGKEIVNKCGGVPLAVKVVSCILYKKKRIQEWKAIRDSSLLKVENNNNERRVYACLMLSYCELPSNLKQCFTLCSMFPTGYMIDREKLIDLWIAHDVLTLVDGVDYLEYTGCQCFNSLVQVCFLQDVHEYDGRVMCHMHDLVHDFAGSILGYQSSLVWPKEGVDSAMKSNRYYCLNEESINLVPKISFEKARAMYVTSGVDFLFDKALHNAKHLRSITLEYVDTKSVPTSRLMKIKNLFSKNKNIENLRYLSISGWGFHTFPEAISNICSLRALHIDSMSLLELPESIGKLKKLRSLNLVGCLELMSLPESIGDCDMISSINIYGLKKLTVIPSSIGRNKNLKALRLGRTNIEGLPPSITDLENLEVLDLQWCEELLELPERIGNLQKLEVLNLEGCHRLQRMPIGIGQLSRLEKLQLFVVGEGEQSAKISELAKVAKIDGELTIRNIRGEIDPDDAFEARLKEKTKLERLILSWTGNDQMNAEKKQAILDGLEPPQGIKDLEIDGYTGEQYARWMLKKDGFQWLTVMNLSNFPNLKHLHGLMELRCLEDLWLCDMPALEGISGGPFPSLAKLHILQLPMLTEVWMVMVTEMSLATEKAEGSGSNHGHGPHVEPLQIGRCLSDLVVEGCPKLKINPYFPCSLENLGLFGSNEQLLQLPDHAQEFSSSSNDAGLHPSVNLSRLKILQVWRTQMTESPSSSEAAASSSAAPPAPPPPPPGLQCGHGWELLQHMTALEYLDIFSCDGLVELPKSMRSLISLQSLSIVKCYNLCVLPKWLGELQSLQKLTIDDCGKLSSLPPSVKHLPALQTLEIHNCSIAFQLPEWLGELCSLREMWIAGCPGLNSFPQSLKDLTSLQELQIERCNALQQLPECLGELRSLRKFKISTLPGLTSFPQSMQRLTSLEELEIRECGGLESIPEWMQCLTALKILIIASCPKLDRCKEEDRYLISHIPRVIVM